MYSKSPKIGSWKPDLSKIWTNINLDFSAKLDIFFIWKVFCPVCLDFQANGDSTFMLSEIWACLKFKLLHFFVFRQLMCLKSQQNCLKFKKRHSEKNQTWLNPIMLKCLFFRFDNLEVRRKCQEAGRGLATSYYAIIDQGQNQSDRHLANHILFAWHFDKVTPHIQILSNW